MMMWLTKIDGGPKRVNHAAVALGHKIYSFGGYCTGENSKEYTSMDVHVLNTTTFRWTKHPVSDLPYFENDDILPFKRYGHTAVVYGDKVYIWGGRNDRGADGVLFCFDTIWHCWTAPKTTGDLPFARDGHTACVWKHYMFIWGGYEEETDTFAESLHALNFNTMEWSYIPVYGLAPMSRDFHTAVCINNKMYIFGGRNSMVLVRPNEEIYSNNIWYLDLNNFHWYCPHINGFKPVGRRSHSAFVYKNKMYIFGGYNSIKNQHYNDMYEFNPENETWREIKPLGKTAPCERRRQACVLSNDRLFVFGGTSPRIPYSGQEELVMDSREDDLIDHCDMHVLDFNPSLKTLCIIAVRKYGLDESVLPLCLKLEIQNMFVPNKVAVSRPSNSAG